MRHFSILLLFCALLIGSSCSPQSDSLSQAGASLTERSLSSTANTLTENEIDPTELNQLNSELNTDAQYSLSTEELSLLLEDGLLESEEQKELSALAK